jgi:sterol desaturase/sphingolipid hydroxylase (fatty acid hydroxylase superfamily)
MDLIEHFKGTASAMGIGAAVGFVGLLFPQKKIAIRQRVFKDIWATLIGIALSLPAIMAIDYVEPRITSLIAPLARVLTAGLKDWPFFARFIAYFMLADFIGYCFHRALHTRLLWRFHRWHHSPTELYWLSGMRGSVLHAFFAILPFGIAFGVLDLPFTDALLIGTTVDFWLHYLHSNWGFKFWRWLEVFTMNHQHHRIHHARDMKMGNSNFGFFFPFWDRAFGTYTSPHDVPENFPLGEESTNLGEIRMSLGLDPEPNPMRLRKLSLWPMSWR